MQPQMIEMIRNNLLEWYQHSARILPWRDKPTPYRVWVSEIMLQQTRVEAVKPYFERFMNEVPTVQALAELADDRLMKLWEGLGYYSRARNLRKAAQMIMDEFNGVVPGDADQLMRLPGIGPYTSGAVASIAYGARVPAVDGNVLRVMSRILAFRDDITDPRAKKKIEQQVYEILPYEKVGNFNQALMELGATICLPNGAPKCGDCPVQAICEGFQLGIMMTLPVKSMKKDRKIEHKTVFVIRYADRYAIRQRQQGGLLAGLWEFPNVEGHLSEEQAIEKLKEWGMDIIEITPLKSAKHVFTHLEWHMAGYFVHVRDFSDKTPFSFVTHMEITEGYSIPSAFKAFKKYTVV